MSDAPNNAEASQGPLPIVPHLMLDEERPYLSGTQCDACGARYIGRRMACSKCFERERLSGVRLPEEGELYTYSITYRSFPGVEVPFVSAIVDLDGGPSIKGVLKGVKPDPDQIEMGMRVAVDYELAPRKDADGNEYMMYFFRPSE